MKPYNTTQLTTSVIVHCTIQNNAILYNIKNNNNTVQYNAMLYNTIKTAQYSAIQYNTMQPHFHLLCSVNSEFLTPLDVAVMTNNIPMAKMLLSHGARESPLCKYIYCVKRESVISI